MKIKGARLIAVEVAAAVAVAGAIAAVAVALSGDPAPAAGPKEGSPEWAAQFDARIKRSADQGRWARSIIQGRGYEATDVLCDVEWGKLGDRQRDLDEYGFTGACLSGYLAQQPVPARTG